MSSQIRRLIAGLTGPLFLRPPEETKWIDADGFAKLRFRDRIRIMSQAYAVQGLGLSLFWAVGFYIVKFALYLMLLWVMCLKGRLGVDSDRRMYIRIVCFNMLWEVAGLGSGCGPIAGKFFPPFTAFFHFVYLGTAKVPLLDRLRAQTKRSIVDVILFALFLNYVSACAVGPQQDIDSQLMALVSSWVLLSISDQTFLRLSRPDLFGSILIVLMLASSAGGGDGESQWLESVRVLHLFVWIFQGFAMWQPTFAISLPAMISGITLLPEALKKASYQLWPDNMRSTAFTTRFARILALTQMTFPLLLGWGGMPSLLGLFAGLGMQIVSIMLFLPIGASAETIWYSGCFMLYAFAFPELHALSQEANVESKLDNHTYPGLQMSNLLLSTVAYLLAAHVTLPWVGLTRPSTFPLAAAVIHFPRTLVGNVASTFWLIDRRAAETKLSKLISYSVLPEVQLQSVYENEDIIQQLQYRYLSMRLSLQPSACIILDVIPRIVKEFNLKVSEAELLERYIITDGTTFGGVALGWCWGENFDAGSQLLQEIQEKSEFLETELLVIEVSPFTEGIAHWTVRNCSGQVISAGETMREQTEELKAQ